MKTLLISIFALGIAASASAQITTSTPAPSDVKQVKTTPTLQANTPVSPAAKKTGAATNAAPADKSPQLKLTNDSKRVEQPANTAAPKKASGSRDNASGINVSESPNRTSAPQQGSTSTEKMQQASPAPTMAAPKN